MKKHLLVMLMALLCVPWAARAQEELTVSDGTQTCDYIPVYGSYMDYGNRTEFIYPASMLADMAGGTITKLTFYHQSDANIPEILTKWVATQTVSMEEVSATTVASSGWLMSSAATVVATGQLRPTTGGIYEIELSNEFEYSGGNLLISIVSTAGGSGNWKGCTFLGVSQTGASCYVTSSTTSNSTSQANFLPKCTFEYTPAGGVSCAKPGMPVVSNITETGATVSWAAAESASYYIVTLNGEEYATPTDTTLPLTSLTGATDYSVSVSAVCTSGDTSSARTVRFRTLCADAIALPYTQGFETMESSNRLPLCWASLYNTISNYPQASTSTRVNGASLYLYRTYSYSSSNADSILMRLPALPVALNQVMVSFYLYTNSYSQTAELGYLTDPDDASTFHVLQTLPTTNSAWREVEYYFDSVTYADSAWLAFRVKLKQDYASFYMDDLTVGVASDCRRPTAATVSGVTYDGATVSWTPDPYALGITDYEVRYATRNDVNATGYQTANSFGESSVTLSDLQPNTTYYAWVRSLCGSEETPWRAAGSFTTDRTCYSVTSATVQEVGYHNVLVTWAYGNNGRGYEPTATDVTLLDLTDSNAVPLNFSTTETRYSTSNLEMGHSYRITLRAVCDPDTAAAVTLNFSTSNCGEVTSEPSFTSAGTSSYYPFYAYNSYGSSYRSVSMSLYPTSALAGLDSIRGLQWYTETTSGGTATLDVYLGYVNKTSFASYTDWIPASALTQVASGATLTKAAGSTGWISVSFDSAFAARSDSAMLAVAVIMNSHTFTSSPYWAYHQAASSYYSYMTIYDYSSSATYSIDNPGASYSYNRSGTNVRPNIRFTGDCDISCFAPVAQVTATSTDDADLAWTPGYNESTWLVQYRADSAGSAWADFRVVNYDTTATVTGLDAGTFYWFRVGTLCGDDTLFSSAVRAKTQCVELSHSDLPYVRDFEAYATSTAEFDPCWTVINYSTYNYIYISSSNAYNGSSKCLYMYPGTPEQMTYAVLPAIDYLTDIDVTFAASMNRTSDYVVLDLGVMTDPNDPSTFVTVATVSSPTGNYTEYTEYDIALSDYEGEGKYIAFRGRTTASNGWGIYIDNVTVAEHRECARPTTVAVSEATSTTALVSWTDPEETGNYEVEYWIVPDGSGADFTPAADDIYTAGTRDTSITLTDLTPNSNYVVNVYTLCGTSDRSMARTANFRTACAPMPVADLPWSDDFESDSTYSINPCWNAYYFNSRGISTSYPYIYDYSGYAHSGSKSMYFTTGDYNYLVFQAIDTVGSAFNITFWAAPNYYYSNYIYTVQIGVMSDPLDTATFEPTATFNLTGSGYQEFEGTTSSYTGNGQYPTIRVYTTYGVYIDDVTIGIASPCAKVNGLTATDVAGVSATLTWQDTANTGSYVIEYTTDAGAMQTATCTTTTVTLNGLSPQTHYTATVYAQCGEVRSAGRTVEFTTGCLEIAAEELPYTEDFEQMPTGTISSQCWAHLRADGDMYYTDGDFSYAYYTTGDPTVSNAEAHGGSQSVRFTTFRGEDEDYYYYTYDNFTMLGLPLFATPLNQLQVSFWYKAASVERNVGLGVGYCTTLDDTSTFTRIETFTPTDTAWHQYTVQMGGTGTPGQRIAFILRARNNVSDYDDVYGYVDDIVVSRGTGCTRPAAVQVAGLTETGCTVTWIDANATRGTYKVQWGTNEQTTTDTFYVMNNLTPNTAYTVSVRKLCNGEYTTPTTVTFTTPCTAYDLPWTEDFESSSTSSGSDFALSCWERLNPYVSYSSYYPYVGNNGENSTKGLYFYNYNTESPVVVLPRFTESDLGQLQLTYSARTSSEGYTWAVGYVTDASDASTFVPVSSFTSSTEYTRYTVRFPQNTAGRIAFRVPSQLYLDNLLVEHLASCEGPQALAVAVYSDSAVVTITDSTNANSYLLTNGSTTTLYQTKVFTVRNLTPNTDYSFTVATLCATGDTTPALTKAFHTPCTPVSLPYSETFDSYTYSYGSNIMPNCWEQLVTSGSQRNELYVYSISGASSQPNVLYSYYPYGQTGNVFAMPEFDGDLNDLVLTYATMPGSSYSGNFDAGYVTNGDASTFVALKSYSASGMSTSAWVYDTVSLANAPAGARIAFRHVIGTSSNYYSWYLDDVKVHETGNCNGPQDFTISADTNSITLTVVDSVAGSNYRVVVTDGDTTISTDFQGNTFTVRNLQQATTYSVSLSTVCENGQATLPISKSVKVPCAPILHTDLPFTEDFQSYTNYGTVMDGCWSTIRTYSNFPNIDYTGNSYFLRSYANESGLTGYVVLPMFDSVNDLEVRFTSNSYSYYGSITVGVMDNASDASTFTAVQTIGLPATDPAAFLPYSVRLTGYNGNGQYVAFRFTHATSYSSLRIDDIMVNVAPSCLDMQSVSIDSIGLNLAAISITDSTHVNNYRLVLTSDYGTDTLMLTSATDTLRNLHHSTQYSYSVASVCSDGRSTLPISGSFHTVCDTIRHTDLPFVATFDHASYGNCWSTFSTYSYDGYGKPQSSYDHTGNGGYSINFYNSYGYDYQVLTTPAFDSTGDLMVTFWARGDGSQLIVGSTDATASNNYTAADTVDLTNDYAYYEVRLNGAAGHRLTFRNLSSDYYKYAYLDDITVMVAPSCDRPQGIAVSDITTTSATVTVTDSNHVNNYELVVIYANGTADTIAISDGNSTQLTGLPSSSSFNLSVRALCTDGNYTGAITKRFSTECDAITALPWHEDFVNMYNESREESEYYGYVSNCWSVIYGTDNTWYVGADRNKSIYNYPDKSSNVYYYSLAASSAGSSYGTTYYDNASILTLPKFGVPMQQLQVTSQAAMAWQDGSGRYTENSGTLEVGVITNPTDGSTFVPYDTIPYTYYYANNAYTFSNHVTDFANYNGPEGHVAYRFTYHVSADYYNVFIHDIVVDAPNACAAPAVVSSSATDVTATVDYTAAADSIEVAYTLGQWDEPTATTGFHNDGTFTLHGLTPDTTYTVGLRAVCEEGSRSLWTLTTVRTAPVVCNATSAPTIEATSFNSVSVSWTAANAETAWLVRVYNNTFDRTDTARTTTATIDGLTAGVAYQVTVQPLCGSDQSVEGPVSEATPFSTDVCQPVSGVSVSNVTAHTAQISWTNGNNGNGTWIVEYGDAGYAQGQGTQVVANTNPFTLTGLEADYVYDVYVRTVCTDDLSSNWAAGGQIATLEAGQAQTYTVSLDVNDPAMGTVTGAGEYEEGSVAVLTATANTGYVFVKWSDENSDNPRRLAVTANISLTAIFATDTTGIGEVAGSSIALYPNPATTTVTVDLGSAEATGATVSVIDLNGREVLRTAATDSRVSLDVSRLAQGAYFVKVTGEHVNAIRKLVVR